MPVSRTIFAPIVFVVLPCATPEDVESIEAITSGHHKLQSTTPSLAPRASRETGTDFVGP